jgi:hypothetical protein
MSCSRAGCYYKLNEDINNNGGTHCCYSCKEYSSHGILCQKTIFIKDEQESFSDEYRVNYYTKNIVKKTVKVDASDTIIKVRNDCTFLTNIDNLEEFKKDPNLVKSFAPWFVGDFINDAIRYFSLCNDSYKNRYFYTMFGDSSKHCDFSSEISQISKVRLINEENRNVILNLQSSRHSGSLNNLYKIDIPYQDKNNKMIWRGISTGYNYRHNMRVDLVDKYQNHPNPDIDVKFNGMAQGLKNENNKYKTDTWLNIQEQLKSKFLISVEGNDVATNLKTVLLSNSVCIMPIPTVSSWFMEDHLVPYQHFIPVRQDFEDLEEKYNWCLNNLDACEKISKNATVFMQQFLNKEKEESITRQVIERYFDHMDIIVS